MGTHPIFESDFDCLTEREKMSYLPSIRPSIIQKRQLFAENRLSRAEVARRREEALYQKFKFITKQTEQADNTELPDLADSEGSDSNISHSAAAEPFMPEMEMTDQDFDTY